MGTKKLKIFPTIWACLIVVIALIMFFTYDQAVNDLKSIVFEQYTTAEFGTVVEKNLSSAKWTSEKNSSNYYTVTVSGFCPDLYSHISAVFNVGYDGDMVYASADHVVINGNYADDWFSIATVMNALCS